MEIGRNELGQELATLREKGLPKLRTLDVPALTLASKAVFGSDDLDSAVAIEQLLRRAVDRLGGGPYGEAAAYLFGLLGGTRGLGPRERRERAADAYGMSAETFRTRHQKSMVEDIAGQVLGLLADQDLRNARTQLNGRRPADSRLAGQWLERFEAYYRMWTHLYALAADLTACRETLLDTDRPYDEPAGEDGSDSLSYTQEDQADGYAQSALYRYAYFEWELQRFMTRYGGLWLASSPEVEQQLADTVYQIQQGVTVFNERDRSWLRTMLADTRNQDLHEFLRNVARVLPGQETYQEWIEWVTSCQCTWTPISEGASPFLSEDDNPGISEECVVHRALTTGGKYCELVDREWRLVADWYHSNPSHSSRLTNQSTIVVSQQGFS